MLKKILENCTVSLSLVAIGRVSNLLVPRVVIGYAYRTGTKLVSKRGPQSNQLKKVDTFRKLESVAGNAYRYAPPYRYIGPAQLTTPLGRLNGPSHPVLAQSLPCPVEGTLEFSPPT